MAATKENKGVWRVYGETLLPATPTLAKPSIALFGDPSDRQTYGLPEPPNGAGAVYPVLQSFWDRLSTGITAYRLAEAINGPPEDPTIGPMGTGSADGLGSQDGVRFPGSGHQSRSPNWSGASIHAADGATICQVVGSWKEPAVANAGSFTNKQAFRSSVWIGMNGHAAYVDAALPQIGTMQQIVWDGAQWQFKHWVWFEWWANTKGNRDNPAVLPVYLDLDVAAGDNVLCSVELIPREWVPADPKLDGDIAKDVFPYVARMFICVEHLNPPSAALPLEKTFVMPFIVYPPKVAKRRVRPSGSTANWIAELPTNIDPKAPFLMPSLSANGESSNRVTFTHCAAALTTDPGDPLFAERTLEVSRRINMFNDQPRGEASLAVISATQAPPISDSSFGLQVDGNDT